MSSHRFLFYDAGTRADSATVTLKGDEHNHLAYSLRCAAGDVVYVTNGCGLILECRVEAVARSATVAQAVSVVEDRPPAPGMILALGTIRKDRFERAFEQCAELGITRFVPFVSDNASLRAYPGRFIARLRKIGIAAIKQSFRSVLPAIDDPVSFAELVETVRATPLVVVGVQDAPPPPPFGAAGSLVVVGPEAGFSPAELESLEEAGARPAGVSPTGCGRKRPPSPWYPPCGGAIDKARAGSYNPTREAIITGVER